jgi:DNA-binding protein
MSEEAIIYIGNKPPMRYVTAMITAYNQQNVNSITIKARGRAISRAVDVAEITRNRFITGLETPAIAIETEQLPAMDGGTRGVSTIAISFQLAGDREAIEQEQPRPREEAPKVEEPEEKEAKSEAAEQTQYALSDVKGIGKATNEKLAKAGVDSVEALASYDPEALSEKTGISAKTCAKLVDAAKGLLD